MSISKKIVRSYFMATRITNQAARRVQGPLMGALGLTQAWEDLCDAEDVFLASGLRGELDQDAVKDIRVAGLALASGLAFVLSDKATSVGEVLCEVGEDLAEEVRHMRGQE